MVVTANEARKITDAANLDAQYQSKFLDLILSRASDGYDSLTIDPTNIEFNDKDYAFLVIRGYNVERSRNMVVISW